MKDRFRLILVAGVLAVLAWTFWHYLGKEAFSTLSTCMLIVVAMDNIRLRRQLRSDAKTQEKDA
jgi:hypothetical protein